MAGSFDYPKIQSVLVTVNLTAPTDLMAVAVIPACSKPDVFAFRQSVQDVLTADMDTPANEPEPVQESGTVY